MNTDEFELSEIEDPLNGDEKRAMKTARDFLGGIIPADGQRIAIFRTRPQWIPGGGGWIETVDFGETSDFSLEGLREAYGGGTYVLKILNNKGKYLAAQTVKIAGDPIHQGRRITQQQAEAALAPLVSTAPARDSEMSELIKALLQNSSKAQRDSFDLLVSLWTNQAKPQGQPTSFAELQKMIEFVDTIRGGAQPPAEDSTMMGMMGLLSQFMASKQQPAPASAPMIPQNRAPRHFKAPLSPPVLPQASPAEPPQASPEAPPQASPALPPQASPAEPPHTIEMGDFDEGEEEPLDLADEIAELPIDELVTLLGEVMGKLPESKTLALMEKLKTV